MDDNEVLRNWGTASPLEAQQVSRRLVSSMSRRRVSGRRHPLGFLHFSEVWDNIPVRLHLWMPNYTVQSDELMIHDHVFHVQSRVLTGEVVDIGYDVIGSDEDALSVFVVSYSEGHSSLVEVDTRVAIVERSRRAVRRWDSYRVEAGDFHRTEVNPSVFTATLVVPIATKIETPRVIGKRGLQTTPHFDRSELNVDEAEAVLERLLGELDSTDP